MVCPPEKTNTALNFDLMKANDTWDEVTKSKLMQLAVETFLVD